jgi:O-antigen chain-terminating methyltransferase
VTERLENEMTRAVERLNDPGMRPAIRIPDSDETTVGAKLLQAYQHSQLDELAAGPPFASLKRVLRRLLRPLLGRQSVYNRTMADAVSELNHQLMLARRELASLDATIEQQRHVAAVHMATLETLIDDINQDGLAPLSSQIADLAAGVPTALALAQEVESAHRVDQQRDELRQLALTQRELSSQYQLIRHLLDALMEDLRRTGAAPDLHGTRHVALSSPHDERTYEAFEDAYRGSATLIAERLRPYLADLTDLKGGALPVADLGSGRGEWLRILREAEIPAMGFDTNERFVEEARADGLDVRIGDAVELLSAQSSRSLGAVTAFQFVEHLSVHDISNLIEAAFVALAPGGALILETPNASNLRVGASAFYRDPTHVRPVHPDWLSFLVGHLGFVGVETRFLHPATEYDDVAPRSRLDDTAPTDGLIADLRWALYGPQDFAVLARKPRSPTR